MSSKQVHPHRSERSHKCIATRDGTESSREDFLSRMPCSIIEIILGLLTLKEAVRTSILSKQWRYKWVARREIEFDIRDELTKWSKYNPKILIPTVLSLQQGTLTKFSLRLRHSRFYPNLHDMLLILSTKKVEELTIELCASARYDLAPNLQLLKHLRSLSITSCIIDLPSTFNGFPLLVNLELVGTLLVNRASGILSGCPLLQRLKMKACTALFNLGIDAPKLVYFEFYGVTESLRFINTPVLEDVRISLVDQYYLCNFNKNPSDLFKIFSDLSALRILHLDASLLKYFFKSHMPAQPLPCINGVEVLRLCAMEYNRELMSYTHKLIRNMPNLSKFEFDSGSCALDGAASLLEEETPADLNQLKIVEIVSFMYARPEIEFVKYILASAPTLQQMLIKSTREFWRAGAVTEIEQFPRASPGAQIMWETIWLLG